MEKSERVGELCCERNHSWSLCSNRDPSSRHGLSQRHDPVVYSLDRAAAGSTRADSEHDPRIVGTTTVEACCQPRGRVAVERYDADADLEAVGAGQRGVQQCGGVGRGSHTVEPEALVAVLLGQRREIADRFGAQRARHPDAPVCSAHPPYATRLYGRPSVYDTWLIQLRDDRFSAVGARCSVRTP